jgi:EAL domain-containing protein (putative c-di-GMP-specific phosphodiesterase class I)
MGWGPGDTNGDGHTISVVLVDDHQMVLLGLVDLLRADPGIAVVGWGLTGNEGLDLARQLRPDVVILDFNLPDMDGAAAARVLAEELPDAKVIILTGSETPGAYYAAKEAGVSAWLRKNLTTDDLLAAVHDVYRGERVADIELCGLPILDELVPYYQPVVDLDSEAIIGFEALARWAHPDRGVLPPAAFIPQAEQTGFINDIARYMVEHATAQLADWQRRFPTDPRRWMSINLSASGLARPATPTMIRTAIEATELDPGDIVLEITETVILEDSDESISQLRALKDLGVALSIDDFGTAHSQLSYLRRFPFDHVKLDSSFTADLPSGERSRLVVEAVDRLGEALHMECIAEGIERPEQAACLRDVGWHLGQGFLYSEPLDAEACTALLSRQASPA